MPCNDWSNLLEYIVYNYLITNCTPNKQAVKCFLIVIKKNLFESQARRLVFAQAGLFRFFKMDQTEFMTSVGSNARKAELLPLLSTENASAVADPDLHLRGGGAVEFCEDNSDSSKKMRYFPKKIRCGAVPFLGSATGVCVKIHFLIQFLAFPEGKPVDREWSEL